MITSNEEVVKKTCPRCKVTKDINDFGNDRRMKDGKNFYCKACIKEQRNTPEYRAKRNAGHYRRCQQEGYREHLKAFISEYKNTPNGRFSAVSRKAKFRGLSFTLTRDQFMSFWQAPCVYCGEPTPTTNLDRINSDKGYEIDNVVPCCRTCNVMKNDLTVEEFLVHIGKIVNKCLPRSSPSTTTT